MKDLRFFGTVESVEVDITFRTDLINAQAQNFTVSQIQVGSEFSTTDESDADHVLLLNEFKRLPYNVHTFIAFAELYNLNLTMAESNGSDLEYLNEVVSPSPSPSVSVSSSSSSPA